MTIEDPDVSVIYQGKHACMQCYEPFLL